MSDSRKATRLEWRPNGSEKWGYNILVTNTLDFPDEDLCVVPDDKKPFNWPSPEEARIAAAAALRDLADRIERGEP